MAENVVNSIKSCDTCQGTKQRCSHLSLPQPLELASKAWTGISMHFVVKLPTEKFGYKNVLVVMDRFTKMAHFIAMTKLDTERTVNAFVKDI